MLVIVLFSLIAAVYFQREVSRRGYDGRKASRYPLIAGGICLVLALIVSTALRLIIPRFGFPVDLAKTLAWIAEGFFFLACFAAIAKSWRAIKRLPVRSSPPARVEGD